MNGPTLYAPEVGPASVADAHGTERVWAAAIRFAGRVWVAPCHIDATALAADGTGRAVREVWAGTVQQGQGFITTRGHFISRADAWVIAEREEQLGSEIVVRGELHSEDLARGHYASRQRRVTSAPVLRIRLAHIRLTPFGLSGIGFGSDPDGKPASYLSDRWTLLRQSDTLAAGHAVEVYVVDREAVAWRRA